MILAIMAALTIAIAAVVFIVGGVSVLNMFVVLFPLAILIGLLGYGIISIIEKIKLKRYIKKLNEEREADSP